MRVALLMVSPSSDHMMSGSLSELDRVQIKGNDCHLEVGASIASSFSRTKSTIVASSSEIHDSNYHHTINNINNNKLNNSTFNR